MRIAVVATSLCLFIVGLATASDAQAMAREETSIPAQPLDSALRALARDRGFHIVYPTGLVNSLRTQGASGVFTRDEALTQLLSGTGLAFRYLDEETVTIVLASTQDAAGLAPGESSRRDEAASFWDRLRLAQTNQATAASEESVASAGIASEGKPGSSLEEIVVTAQKRAERLQDVPLPVTALQGSDLSATNQVSLRDYYSKVPGLNLAESAGSTQFISIRGITTSSYTNPRVGIVLEDMPFGSSLQIGGGSVVPEIDAGDLARIEVLRGPQGTLYGASSLGGLLKYVTVDPSTEGFSGRVETGLSSVRNGADAGYQLRASANIPISDTAAIRISGFTRQEPGYIDNPVTGIEGVNRQRISGGRLAMLWQPSGDWSVKLSGLVQEQRAYGANSVNLRNGLGDLQQDDLPGTGEYYKRSSTLGATLNGTLGRVALTSITGYNKTSFNGIVSDDTAALGGLAGILLGVGGASEGNHNEVERFTQEVRLSLPLTEKIGLLLGGFCDDQDSSFTSSYYAVDTPSGRVQGMFLAARNPTRYSEYSGFTNLTFQIADRFDIQAGARQSQLSITGNSSLEGPYVPAFVLQPSPVAYPEVDVRAHAFTYLLTPRFKITPDVMVYARWATGYGPGGPNFNLISGAPTQYEPEKTRVYEIGTKGEFFGRRLSVDASVYYVDWSDIQLSLQDPVTLLVYTGNGSRAKSEGVELALKTRPLPGLSLDAWVAYDNAVLTKDFPNNVSGSYGVSGDRLPNTPRYSGNFSIEQEIPLRAAATAFVGGELSYVGERIGNITASELRQIYPSYVKGNVYAGVRYDSWTTSLFVDNVADKRGIVSGGLGLFLPHQFYYIRPRTIGLNVSRAF
jgi:outer membrane receptor protein involved in Fe transport